MTQFAKVIRHCGAMLLASGLLVLPMRAHAQIGAGSISGSVTDNTGAAVPGARVVLHNRSTGTDRNTPSNGSGSFTFPPCPQATTTAA